MHTFCARIVLHLPFHVLCFVKTRLCKWIWREKLTTKNCVLNLHFTCTKRHPNASNANIGNRWNFCHSNSWKVSRKFNWNCFSLRPNHFLFFRLLLDPFFFSFSNHFFTISLLTKYSFHCCKSKTNVEQKWITEFFELHLSDKLIKLKKKTI